MAVPLREDSRLHGQPRLRTSDQSGQATARLQQTQRRRQRVRDLQARDANEPPLARHLRGGGPRPSVLFCSGRGSPRPSPGSGSSKSLLTYVWVSRVLVYRPLSRPRAIRLTLAWALCSVALAACGGTREGTTTIVLWYPKLPGYITESSSRAVIKAELPLLRSKLGGHAKVVTTARGRKRCTASTRIDSQVARPISKYAGQTVTVSVYGAGKRVRSLCKSLTERR